MGKAKIKEEDIENNFFQPYPSENVNTMCRIHIESDTDDFSTIKENLIAVIIAEMPEFKAYKTTDSVIKAYLQRLLAKYYNYYIRSRIYKTKFHRMRCRPFSP